MAARNVLPIHVTLNDGLSSKANAISNSLRNMGRSVPARIFRSFSQRISSLTRSLLSFRGIAFSAIAALGISGLGGGFIKAASFAENLSTKLGVVVSTQEEANKIFADASQFAGTVAQSYEDIASGATQLRSVSATSAEETREFLRLATDLASFTGRSVTEMANQLNRAFIAGAGAADYLREQGIFAMAGINTAVKHTGEETKKKLLEAWRAGVPAFAGQAQAFAQTFSGMVSMIGDKWGQFQRMLMASGPFDAVRGLIARIDDGLAALISDEESVREWGETVGGAITTIGGAAIWTASKLPALINGLNNTAKAGKSLARTWLEASETFGTFLFNAGLAVGDAVINAPLLGDALKQVGLAGYVTGDFFLQGGIAMGDMIAEGLGIGVVRNMNKIGDRTASQIKEWEFGAEIDALLDDIDAQISARNLGEAHREHGFIASDIIARRKAELESLSAGGTQFSTPPGLENTADMNAFEKLQYQERIVAAEKLGELEEKRLEDLAKATAEIQKQIEATNLVAHAIEAGAGIAAGFRDTLADSFEAFVKGEKSAGDALKDFASNFVSALIRVGAQLVATIALAATLAALMSFATFGANVSAGSAGLSSMFSAIASGVQAISALTGTTGIAAGFNSNIAPKPSAQTSAAPAFGGGSRIPVGGGGGGFATAGTGSAGVINIGTYIRSQAVSSIGPKDFSEHILQSEGTIGEVVEGHMSGGRPSLITATQEAARG